MTHLFPNDGATPPWVACPALPRPTRGRTLLSPHVALPRARAGVLSDGAGAVILRRRRTDQERTRSLHGAAAASRLPV